MPIPSFHELVPSVLLAMKGREETSLDDFESASSTAFNLTVEDREQLLPSGQQRVLRNRVGWAKWYLEESGYLSTVRRGRYKLTSKGIDALSDPSAVIPVLLAYRKDRFQSSRLQANQTEFEQLSALDSQTPEEAIEVSYASLLQTLTDDLLKQIKLASPRFFENLVVQLMLAMGYGGSQQEAGKAVGRSGDGGIDGIINEDRLGLDAIYLQAKRWEGVVGRPEIMKFVGALAGQRATKGVFITTSGYTKEATEYALTSQYKIVLIDGARLADLMIEHNLGVSVSATYQLKRIDSDFFADE